MTGANMNNQTRLCLCLCFCFLLSFPYATAQQMYFQRGPDKFPVRDLPDGAKSVVIDGRTYFLVAKEDLAALSSESEALRALVAKNDSLFAKHDALLARYANYEAAAETLTTRQETQMRQAERVHQAYEDLYLDMKRLAGLSPWSLLGGVGVCSSGADTRLMGSVGVGYQQWLAQYQFARDYSGVIVGFRLSL